MTLSRTTNKRTISAKMNQAYSQYKHVLANILRSRYNTSAVWTKWKGARSRRVDFIAGEGSLRRTPHACVVRAACGGPESGSVQ